MSPSERPAHPNPRSSPPLTFLAFRSWSIFSALDFLAPKPTRADKCNHATILNLLRTCDLGWPPILILEEFLYGEGNESILRLSIVPVSDRVGIRLRWAANYECTIVSARGISWWRPTAPSSIRSRHARQRSAQSIPCLCRRLSCGSTRQSQFGALLALRWLAAENTCATRNASSGLAKSRSETPS